jgi:Holliday junction resolvase RusA-like endonuclease
MWTRTIVNNFFPIRPVSGSIGKIKNDFAKRFCSIIEEDRKKGNMYYKIIKRRIRIKVVFHFYGMYTGDIDNLLKCLFDALQHAKVIKNDNQIRYLEALIEENSLIEGVSLDIKTNDK